MAYEEQVWANGAPGNTPLAASALNHMEAGIDAAHDAIEVVQVQANATQSALNLTDVAVESLDGRLNVVEDALPPIQSDITSLEGQVSDLSGALDTFKESVSLADFASEDVLNGTVDAGAAMQAWISALNAQGGGKGTVPQGSQLWFDGSTVVFLVDNIELDLRGSRIFKTDGTGSYCIFVGMSDGVGYGAGPSNVVIKNGIFEGNLQTGGTLCVLSAHHMQNVTIENCEMYACTVSGHTFDLAACDNVIFRNCRWYGSKPWAAGDPGRPETIELDQSLNGALSYTDVAGTHDGLLCKNVTVEDCMFLPYDDGTTVWPAPNPLGAHGQREGQYYENITVRNVTVIDPMNDDTGGTATGADNVAIRGLIHFPTVKDLHISNMKVHCSTPRTARVVMVQARSTGTLASGDPNTSTASGAWAEPQPSKNITIKGLVVTGMTNTQSNTNPIVNIMGVTGCPVENVEIEMSLDGGYKEAVLLYKVNDARVNFTRCKDTESGARLVECRYVQVQGNFHEVDLPVRIDNSAYINVGPCTDLKTEQSNAFCIITNSSTNVTCSNIVAPNRTWLYGASGAERKPGSHAQSAILGPAVS